jgi:hypothetical protein
MTAMYIMLRESLKLSETLLSEVIISNSTKNIVLENQFYLL